MHEQGRLFEVNDIPIQSEIPVPSDDGVGVDKIHSYTAEDLLVQRMLEVRSHQVVSEEVLNDRRSRSITWVQRARHNHRGRF